MSIILKGNDMPDKKQVYHIELLPTGRCAVIKFKDNKCYEVSSYDTRAIQIPRDHGRIIDASELIKSYMKGTKTDIDDFYDTIDIIDNAPTILESEE